MNTEQFISAYNESRNGTDRYHRVLPFVPRFLVTDGVLACADAGCFWLTDIFATELTRKLNVGDMGIVKVKVKDKQADLSMSLSDDTPSAWRKHIDFTDMPEGTWTFYISNDG